MGEEAKWMLIYGEMEVGSRVSAETSDGVKRTSIWGEW